MTDTACHDAAVLGHAVREDRSASTQPAPDLPYQQAALQPFAGTSRTQGDKQKRGPHDPARVTPDRAEHSHPPIDERKPRTPRFHVVCQCDSLCRSLRHQLAATFSQLGQFWVHDPELSCCRSLDNSARLASNNLGLLRALCMANHARPAPAIRNRPVRPPSAASRCDSQKATTIRIASNTTPTPRKNKETSPITRSEVRCARSSARSVDSNSRRV